MSAPSEIDITTLQAFPLPSLDQATDKDSRGRVLVVAGGAQAPGAAILSGVAALRAGAGKLQLAATAQLATGLGLAVPEAAVIAVPAKSNGEMSLTAAKVLTKRVAKADAVVVGPGMMEPPTAGPLAKALMSVETNAGFVIDAAAMTGLGRDHGSAKALNGRLVITPHAGEMAAITGLTKDDVEKDPLGIARTVAARAQAVVVMKGEQTFVVSPDGAAWIHTGGVIGLATSGSGDVLAGLIGGVMARGASPLVAAIWGVCIHARAGERLSERIGVVGFLARELLAEIPLALRDAEWDETK